MRAGLIIYGSLDSMSGGYLYDRQLVRYLQSQGDEVEIISLPWRSYGQHLFDNSSGPLRTLLEQGGYDVMLQDELNHPSLFRLNATLQHRPAPIVSIVHHLRSSEKRPDWQNRAYRLVEQRYLNTVDAFVYNSRTTRTVVSGLLRTERPSVVAIPGRDHVTPQMTPRAAAARATTGPLRLLFVGNILPRKGLHVLLAAVAQLPPEIWVLDIVGDDTIDPAYTAEIDRLINRLPDGAHVSRHGRVDDAVLSRHYAASQVLVVPSSYEGYGIVYAEALGYGLAVIGSTAGAAMEVVEDGVSGFLVPPDDAVQLAKRLADLAADRSLLAATATRALEGYAALPTWAESMDHVRQFLLAMIARHGEAI